MFINVLLFTGQIIDSLSHAPSGKLDRKADIQGGYAQNEPVIKAIEYAVNTITPFVSSLIDRNAPRVWNVWIPMAKKLIGIHMSSFWYYIYKLYLFCYQNKTRYGEGYFNPKCAYCNRVDINKNMILKDLL